MLSIPTGRDPDAALTVAGAISLPEDLSTLRLFFELMTCNNMRRVRFDEFATVDMFLAIIGYADKYEAPMVKDRIKLLLA